MAKALNKSRIRLSKLAITLSFILLIFGKEYWLHESSLHETFDYLGYFLLAICALGRLYSTAFLGGHKNQTLITWGPYSVVRNPLYTFSLIGVTGIAFICNHPLIIIGLPLFFYFMYVDLIKREEKFLEKEFGKKYKAYTAAVPRLIPNLSLYKAPETVEMSPRFLNNGLFDAIWWFSAFPIIELIEWLHDTGIVKTILNV